MRSSLVGYSTRDTYFHKRLSLQATIPLLWPFPATAPIFDALKSFTGKDPASGRYEDDDQVYDTYNYKSFKDGGFNNKYTKEITEVHYTS